MQVKATFTMSPDIVGGKKFYIKIKGVITAFIIEQISFKYDSPNIVMEIRYADKNYPDGLITYLALNLDNRYERTFVNTVCLLPEDFLEERYVEFVVPNLIEVARQYNLGSTVIQSDDGIFVRRWQWDGKKAVPDDSFEIKLIEINGADYTLAIIHDSRVEYIHNKYEYQNSRLLRGTYLTEEECVVHSINQVVDFKDMK